MAHGNRRVHYSTGFKLNVIALAEVTGNRAAAREFKVGETCVRRWRKLKEDLVQCGGKRFCFTGPRNGRFPEVGGELAQAIHHRRQESLPVNASWVLLKAREIAKQHSVYENGLKVSPSWVDKFRKTNGVYLRPKTCISQNKGVPCLGEGFENEQDRSENETNIKGTSEQRERERVGGNTETVNDLKKLWKSPRDTFMKYKRDSQTKSGQARKSPIHWKYWNMMRFLKPYTSNERMYRKIPLSSDDEDKDDERRSEIIELDEEMQELQSMQDRNTEIPSTARVSIPSHSSLVGKRRKKDHDYISWKVFQYLSARLKGQEQAKQEEPPDADKLFLLSLYPPFQELDPCVKSLLKIKIQQLVHESRFPLVAPTPF
uniref:HTH CENPB-type domain-containing protein n=1 Tax=Eptatretus burgeri TaxID=7764 RepID=A0A8C4QR41_EPTBU